MTSALQRLWSAETWSDVMVWVSFCLSVAIIAYAVVARFL